MKIDIKITDKERHFLYRLLAVVLSTTLMATGIYAVSFLDEIEIITTQPQRLIAVSFVFLQWWLITTAVFKHYR